MFEEIPRYADVFSFCSNITGLLSILYKADLLVECPCKKEWIVYM